MCLPELFSATVKEMLKQRLFIVFISVIMSEVVAGEICSRFANTAGIPCSQGSSLYCYTIIKPS